MSKQRIRQVRLHDPLMKRVDQWANSQVPRLTQTQAFEIIVRKFFGEEITLSKPIDKSGKNK